jgi:hypothetical protein
MNKVLAMSGACIKKGATAAGVALM